MKGKSVNFKDYQERVGSLLGMADPENNCHEDFLDTKLK